MSYLQITVQNETITLPYTTNTLRFLPKWTLRRQPLESNEPPFPLYWGEEITGCLVTRLTADTVPFLFSLLREEILTDGHLSGSQNVTFSHRKRNRWDTPITVTEISENRRTTLPDLTLIGYTLSAYRQSAFTLKLDLQGQTQQIIPLRQTLPSSPQGRFFSLNTPPTLNDTSLTTLAHFSLTGEKHPNGEIRETLTLRQKNPIENIKENSFSFTTTTPREYEANQPERWDLIIPKMIYLGSTPYDTDRERWGWEHRYELWDGSESITYGRTV